MNRLLPALLVITALLLQAPAAQACTTILVTDTSGRAYHGRTLEYSVLLPLDMTYFPAGTKVVSSTPAGSPGLTFDTKYPILGMSFQVVTSAKQVMFLEGINNQGVTVSANWLSGTESPAVGEDAARILAVNDLGAWVLGNFKTVAEAKEALTSGQTEFWVPADNVVAPGIPLPVHYAINDKSGDSIVVEFTDGKINVYDNPVGVMTNGPEFPWHLKNLQNYTFTNVDKNTGQLGKLKLQTQDAGIALTALPSAETSQGRFVKAAFYANYVRKAKTPDEAIVTLAHLMNNFDRPYDLTVDEAGGTGDGVRGSGTSSEVTVWTTLQDLSRNLLYFRSINAMNWAVIDMNKLKDVKEVKSVSTFDVDKAGADSFKLFYPEQES